MTLVIAQISDIHAKAGAASMTALKRAIAYLGHQEPDALIVSGDVGGKPHDESYALVSQALSSISSPVFMVPGNADRRDEMRDAFRDTGSWRREGQLHVDAVVADRVRLLGLDVTVPGETHGEITEDCLNFVREALAREPALPVLVFMHQHPFALHSPDLDRNMCRNVDPLRDLLDDSPVPILALVCGHAHRAVSTRFGRTHAMMCPSLVKANPALIGGRGDVPATDPPGLLLHVIDGDRLVSHVVSMG